MNEAKRVLHAIRGETKKSKDKSKNRQRKTGITYDTQKDLLRFLHEARRTGNSSKNQEISSRSMWLRSSAGFQQEQKKLTRRKNLLSLCSEILDQGRHEEIRKGGGPPSQRRRKTRILKAEEGAVEKRDKKRRSALMA